MQNDPNREREHRATAILGLGFIAGMIWLFVHIHASNVKQLAGFVFFMLAAAGVLWVIELKSERQRRRYLENRCIHCGYDLRASKGRCPECGKHFPPSLWPEDEQ